jgi:hypothetical protein
MRFPFDEKEGFAIPPFFSPSPEDGIVSHDAKKRTQREERGAERLLQIFFLFLLGSAFDVCRFSFLVVIVIVVIIIGIVVGGEIFIVDEILVIVAEFDVFVEFVNVLFVVKIIHVKITHTLPPLTETKYV